MRYALLEEKVVSFIADEMLAHYKAVTGQPATNKLIDAVYEAVQGAR